MKDALARKLEGYEELTDDDRLILSDLIVSVRQVRAHVDLIREGADPENVHLILSGFACGYRKIGDGCRQIMAFRVPGDFCDLNVFVRAAIDHSVSTVTACKVAVIPRSNIDYLTKHHPRMSRVLWLCTLVDKAVLREWLVNTGKRPAKQRIAHLLCEVHARLQVVGGVTNDNAFAFPFTQADLGDALGLSAVHVNRALQQLRSDGLITLNQRLLTIVDAEELHALCSFDRNYLHLRNARWQGQRAMSRLSQVG